MSYHVVVTRDGDGWIADVPALRGTHTWARRPELERHAAEVASETRELAGQLPVSDTAILPGVSKGRITQLQVPARAPRTRTAVTRNGQ